MKSLAALLLAIGGGAILLISPNGPEGARAKEEGKIMREEVRRPAVAGSFYPSDPQTLSREVRDFFSRVPREKVGGEIVALVSPHAGYIYSGQVAAYAFKLVEGMKYDAVVVVAPSHRAYFHGASVYDRGGYETPLGLLPVDKGLCQKLKEESNLIHFVAQAHAQEHSLEVQLPFLQEALGQFHLVPIVIGDQSYRTCEAVGKAIARATQGKKVLLVASTDLSHFHSYDEAVKLDNVILEDLRAFDPKRLAEDLNSGKGEACGGGPVLAAMIAAQERGANGAQVLKYLNSGDVTGDRSSVVGYGAATFVKNPQAVEKEMGRKKAGISLGLTEDEKKTLRQMAYSAIEGRLRGQKPARPGALSKTLMENRGAFVSLHKRGELRGCIGQIQPSKPLCQTVQEMAMAAAFNDPRFEPLTSAELQDIDLEISVLTPLQRVKDPKEIEIGKHGLYIKRGFYSGLLLPQVATQFNWDRTTFLEETCRKAGLPRHAWKEKDVEIYLFSADIF
jgi:AmmeMemoRadiSam system protein B/AmmeMemoRadiSam system protein A